MSIISRNKYYQKIITAINKVPIVVLIGARQVGKTTLLQNLSLKKPSVYLHGQNPEQSMLFEKISIIEKWLSNNLHKDLDGYLFIDEFQYIPDISTKLKILTDINPKLKVICTGSSSLDILQKVKESLAGRIRIIEVYSLSIGEYLLFNDKDISLEYMQYDINVDGMLINKKIQHYLNDYLVYGGLPRQSLENNHAEKVAMLTDIFRTYLQRDVRQFVQNDDFIGFNKMLGMIALQVGNLINVNELSAKSGLSYKKTEEYLDLLQQMYIIKLLDPYHTNKRKVITKMKKVYFTDLGMRNVIIKDFRPIDIRNDAGALFENFVLLELLKYSQNIYSFYFYRTLDGSEIDFVIETDLKKILVETKFKSYKFARNLRNIEAFTAFASPDDIFVINKDLNMKTDKYHYLPAVLTGQIFS